jgi:hypothetical protein
MMFRAVPLLLLLLLPMAACPLGPFGGADHKGATTVDGGADPADSSQPPFDHQEDGAADQDGFIGLPVAAGSTYAAADGEAPADDMAPAVARDVAAAGWGSGEDGGVYESDATLPAADPASSSLALARVSSTTAKGCGEPALCFMRVAIVTASGRVYTAMVSPSYPQDNCARNILTADDLVDAGADDPGAILIGDSAGRLANRMCSASSPRINVGFLIPKQVTGAPFARQWFAGDGFQSQWVLSNGVSADNGLYLPVDGRRSTLDIRWLGRFSGGEAYGSLVVPLRNKVTGALARGELLFDVRLR